MTTYCDDFSRLKRAIDSILAQSLRVIELFVVFEPDDKNAEAVERSYTDARLVVIRLAERRGMAGCFNAGLERAGGRYIARMDSDDYSYAIRLERQIAFLREHPAVSLVGAACRLVDRQGNILGARLFPIGSNEIIRNFTFTTPILHPTVVWDREKVGYDVRYDVRYPAEDLELWLRLLEQGHQIANMPEILIDYTQPDNYRRPLRHWRGNFRVRLMHWRLAFRCPLLHLGIVAFALLSVAPRQVVDFFIGRNRVSDFLRSISREVPSEFR